MEYYQKLNKLVVLALKCDGIQEKLEEKLEDIVLFTSEEQCSIYNYHFKCFQNKKNNKLNYIFYKYSEDQGFEFIKDSSQHSFLLTFLYIEIKNLISMAEILQEINST
ncbi:hypothetical protein [Marixanthomonas spongiae]|nr:hypothetical protein [Marixanthomonas spongiae]